MKPISPINNTERLTRNQKEENDFAWYKAKMDSYDNGASYMTPGYGGVSEYKRMKVNYDLFNNKIDHADFAYVCTPFGAQAGQLPATMENRDISSYRLKALIGMEMRRPFGYSVMATNKEATTRKEAFESGKIRDYVINAIMLPIQQDIELKYQEQLQGDLTPQQKQEIQAQIAMELKTATPPEVKQYMLRDHQDPSEVQGQQIVNYLMRKEDIRKKYNLGWKHALLSAYEIYWMGIIRQEPMLKVINPMRFSCDKSSDMMYIEDGAWACAEFKMAPSELSAMFDFTDKELDEIYKHSHQTAMQSYAENMFAHEEYYEEAEEANKIRVKHFTFKGLRRIGWLDYIDPDGVLQTKMMVDESYKLNPAIGDIKIRWEWINEVYEGYKIGADIYKKMQPIEGQFKDMDNLYTCKLPYYGGIYDNTNSEPTSPMDRMKMYQYLHNVVVYRIELLIASDKGKKLLMNINAIPAESGIDIEKWQYFFESTPFAWYNPDEEGVGQADVNAIAKVLDMSLASQIDQYIQLAEYLDQKCGKSIGVTDPVLGQTAVSERVGNNQQNLVQTSHMLEPYFDMHSSIKKNVLQGLLDLSKVAYANSDKEYLNYVLDDMSKEILKLDKAMLKASTLGIFMEDSSMSEEIKNTIGQLAHAAMQNQKIELSDVLKVIRQDSIQEAEESLLVAEQTRVERDQTIAENDRKFQAEEAQKQRDENALEHDREKEKIVLKETERRKTEIQKQAILSVGFNEDKDTDKDGRLDAFEIAQEGLKAKIEMSKEAREDRALDHQIENDKERNAIDKQKAKSTASRK